MLNVHRLRILYELHQRGTLAAVAQALNYTPSAVSQQLSLLEKETGAQLLERVGRTVRLTDRALVLAAHTETVLSTLEQAETELEASQDRVAGTLRVASFQTAMAVLAPPALTMLSHQFPELRIQLIQREVTTAYEGLRNGEFDLIVGEEYPGIPEPVYSNIDQADLYFDDLVLLVPPKGPWSTPAQLADLAKASWAVDPANMATGAWVRNICRDAGFEPTVQYETTDPFLQAHLATSGHAVSIVSALIASNYVDRTRMMGLPGRPQRRLYTAVRSGRSQLPAVRAFRRALTFIAADMAPPAPPTRLDEAAVS
ncbi:LysR family transcriptional regulator [Citricoccus sp. NR2]|uniref:LysR family transcriptional regulator n=1 Tax=Citricoccus sp. NR2 TaxID=3004095 RepID=UPI0022DE6DCD|nr:LysR family transcriptional regulator [Citricoccus sp. NR2]WBL19604.1 LysR family transcriptional regulator [Citricoccus sp. NR2]